jgi:hypothetical protein
MKAAIFQGLYCHYEMIGYAIDFCKVHGIRFDIIADDTSVHGQWWREYYASLWANVETWIRPNDPSIDFDQYQCIFMLTDDDPYHTAVFREKYGHKTICIDHFYKHRGDPVYAHVATRPYLDSPEQTWAIPTFFAIPERAKLDELLKKPDPHGRIHICIVGHGHVPPSIEFLKNTFKCTEAPLHVHVIARSMALTAYEDERLKVSVYPDAPTETMYDVLHKCRYVFCSNAISDHVNRHTSGAISLAFGTGNRLIIPRSWNEHYGFKSAITYDPADPVVTLASSESIRKEVASVYNETCEMITARNDVFVKLVAGLARE